MVFWVEIDAVMNTFNCYIFRDVHCKHVKVTPTVEWEFAIPHFVCSYSSFALFVDTVARIAYGTRIKTGTIVVLVFYSTTVCQSCDEIFCNIANIRKNNTNLLLPKGGTVYDQIIKKGKRIFVTHRRSLDKV